MKLLLIILTILNPVRWSGEQVGDSVLLTAQIDSGWHMTLISIGDSMVGEDYATSYQCTMPQSNVLPVRFIACDDQQCLAPEIYTYSSAVSSGLCRRSTDGRTVSCRRRTDGEPTANRIVTEPLNSSSNYGWLFLMGILGGLLAILTPCIWPIIPMTVSFFLKKGGGWRDALVYGLSIVLIYVGLGLLITVIFGASALNALATNAIVNLFFFALLVVFALSFFGLFEITLPDSWSTRLDKKARSTGGFVSILLMALTLVIVSFSCTGPIIGTLLVEAAGKSLLAPAVGMLGFALALALPFALFALFPHWMQQLPKSGEWMRSIKVTLAFVELAFSLKFLSVADLAYGWGILPRWLFIALWAACFVGLGIYLVRKSWVGKSLAIVSWLFALYLLPGIWGAPVKAIAAFAPPMDEQLSTYSDYGQGLQVAAQTHRPVLVHFTGYGCVNCRKMEQYVLADSAVQAQLQNYVHIMLYVDSRRDENANGIEDGIENATLQREQFGSNAQPYFVLLDEQGRQVGTPQAFTVNPQQFIDWLNRY
ncbi:MAG: thioredoxin family protein [Paludibacteraceae bacterium]|nr:thioredoxin family protein [Paludibacteraceae bacterium]